jgi:hypothetical protein
MARPVPELDQAGDAKLVARVPESSDACPERFDRINEAGRQTAAFAPGVAAAGSAMAMTPQTK